MAKKVLAKTILTKNSSQKKSLAKKAATRADRKLSIAPKPRAESVRQRVYLELRRAMEQGTFKPGTRLPASREQAKTKELGDTRYITKPMDLEGFLAIGEILKEILLAGRARGTSSMGN